jgi:hypothetical protein
MTDLKFLKNRPLEASYVIADPRQDFFFNTFCGRGTVLTFRSAAPARVSVTFLITDDTFIISDN